MDKEDAESALFPIEPSDCIDDHFLLSRAELGPDLLVLVL